MAAEARRLSATLREHGAADGSGQEGPFQGPFRGTYLWRPPLPRGDERMAPSLHPLGWARGGAAPVETAAPAAAGRDAGHEKLSPLSSSEESEQRSWFLQLSTALGLEQIVSGSAAAESRDGMASPAGVAAKAARGPSPEDGAGLGASGRVEGSALVHSRQRRHTTQAAECRELRPAKEKDEVLGQPVDAVSLPTAEEGSNPAERGTMSALSTSLTSSQRSVTSFGSGDTSSFEGDASILSHASTVGEEVGLMNASAAHAVEGPGEEKGSKDRRGMDLLQKKIDFLEDELRRSREGSREREVEDTRERGLQHATIVALEERCAALEQERGRSRWSRRGPDLGLGHVSGWLPPVGDASMLETVRRNSQDGLAEEERDRVGTEEEGEWEWEWERWGKERRDLQWRVERAGAKERQGIHGVTKQRGRGRSFEHLRVIPPPSSEDAYTLLIPFLGTQ